MFSCEFALCQKCEIRRHKKKPAFAWSSGKRSLQGAQGANERRGPGQTLKGIGHHATRGVPAAWFSFKPPTSTPTFAEVALSFAP
jgi:hypothetical protein